MAQSPDIRVRLTPQGVTDVIAALRTVQREADRAGVKARAGLGDISGILGSIRAALPALGFTAAVTGFTLLAKGAADFADEMGKGAQKVGTSAENLSVLASAAATADVEQGALTNSLSRLVRNLGELRQGTDEQVEAFGELGLSAKDFVGKDTVQGFDMIAQRLSRMQDRVQASEIAIRIFGRSGAQLMPLLNDLGTKGFAAVREEAERLGIVVSSDLANAAEQMNDSFTLMQQQAKGLALSFISGLAPAIVDTFSTLQEQTSGEGTTAMKEFGEAAGRVFGPLIAGLKLVGGLAGSVFKLLIRNLGAAGAGLTALFTGDFRGAAKIAEERIADFGKEAGETFEEMRKDANNFLTVLGKEPKPIQPKLKPTVDDDAVEKAAESVEDKFKKLSGKGPIVELKAAEESARKHAELADRIRESEAELMRDLVKIQLGGNAERSRAQELLTFAEMSQLGLRVQAHTNSYRAEVGLHKQREQAMMAAIQKQHGTTRTGDKLMFELSKQSAKERMAIEQKHIDDLIKLRDAYVARFKSAADKLKALEQEIKDETKGEAAIQREDRLALMSEEQKFAALALEAKKKLEELKKAVSVGDVDTAQALRKEIQDIAGDLRQLDPPKVDKADVQATAREIRAAATEAFAPIREQQKAAIQAEMATAAAGITAVTQQIEAAKTRYEEFLSWASNQKVDTQVGLNENSLASVVATIRDRLAQEQFFVNVQPRVASAALPGYAQGGGIRGWSPTPTADNLIIRATAGEFMQPVQAVRHYGVDFMEAIRNLEVPRYAAGGTVGGADTPASERIELAINIDGSNLGSVFGPRDTVGALADALKQLDRG